MVLICLILVTNDIEHIFKYLLAISMSWQKCLFSSFPGSRVGASQGMLVI